MWVRPTGRTSESAAISRAANIWEMLWLDERSESNRLHGAKRRAVGLCGEIARQSRYPHAPHHIKRM